jgi:hypothetical protein
MHGDFPLEETLFQGRSEYPQRSFGCPLLWQEDFV